MGEKKRFLLRIDPRVHEALAKWAADDLRSVNAQIEFLLKASLQRAGRLAEGGGDADRDARADEEDDGA